ncbi:MAG: alpha/beta fold hydrolase [Xanthomonadales bacterium]|nr:alpha/beta fold hydrolase [Xanthomonadales bacterium]
MRKTWVAALLVALQSTTLAGGAPGLSGLWQGEMAFRGDQLPLALTVSEAGGEVTVLLDIPSLVYAQQPIPASIAAGGGLEVELPFGIGQMSLARTTDGGLLASRDGFELTVARTEPPTVEQHIVRFGPRERPLEGTLFVPGGCQPCPIVIVAAGSANANRNQWSYASWARFYAGLGVGAFIYDRRPDLERLADGQIASIEDHASDLAQAIETLRAREEVRASHIGLVGSSRGAWIAMATARADDRLAFVILNSVAAASPAEQEVSSALTRMRRDGLNAAELSEARAYLRLYFHVARSGQDWDSLEQRLQRYSGARWMEYVDQPRSLEDLAWWQANMDFDAISALSALRMPVLAAWGGDDPITPWANHRLVLEQALLVGGNERVITRVYPQADHRMEVGFRTDEQGRWRWFGMAPGLLDDLGAFVRRHVGGVAP